MHLFGFVFPFQFFNFFTLFIPPYFIPFVGFPCLSLHLFSVPIFLLPFVISNVDAVRYFSNLKQNIYVKFSLNWWLLSKYLSLTTSSRLLEVCCFRCFGAIRVATLSLISPRSVKQAVDPGSEDVRLIPLWCDCIGVNASRDMQ